jgi:hypothetical protein
MLLVLVAIQVCLWAQASNVVQAAATRGDESACVEGGSLTSAEADAREMISQSGSGIVSDPSVEATLMAGDTVQMKVSGTAESILPWLRIPVSALRTGTRQEFRASG